MAFYLSANPTYEGGGVDDLIALKSTETFAAGAIHERFISFTLNTLFPPDSYYVLARVFPYPTAVTEQFTSNNVGVYKPKITLF